MANKIDTVFCITGENKGHDIKVERPYTEDQLNAIKARTKFMYDGKDYAGYCRRCGYPVLQKDCSYQENTNYYGTLTVDIFHRLCL